jgi:16S rRNA (uracil1498-N3)-methyltransferase
MSSPYFFEPTLPSSDEFILKEETSRHIAQVLRMKKGEPIRITNGNGQTISAEIISPDNKKTKVKKIGEEISAPEKPQNTIAVSLIKNTNRFEWIAEKATEIGILAILPLICKRSEKTHFRQERIRSIVISAMLQSQQSWLPEISEPVKFSDMIKNSYEQKFIAHCLPEQKKGLKDVPIKTGSKIILIGPEGDFTEQEIELAIAHNYLPVSLGETRLRTETAAIVGAVLLR